VIPLKDTTIKAETIIQPANKNTFTVRSTKKDSSHPKYQQGTDIGFTVNGVPGKDFVLSVVKLTLLILIQE